MLTALVIAVRDTASRLYDRACGLGATLRGILLARAVKRAPPLQHYADPIKGIACGKHVLDIGRREGVTFDLYAFSCGPQATGLARCNACLQATTKGGRS